MAQGKFITFEGGEGAGKSTQLRRLQVFLEERGIVVVATREPGGTPGAEEIRRLLVTGDSERWDAWTEALLVTAARRDHVERVIRPALALGRWVLCDRFLDSTLAYQGFAGGLGAGAIEALHSLAIGRLRPDLTMILDIDPARGLARAAARRGDEERFEGRDLPFHEQLRDAFRQIATAEPTRCQLVSAEQNENAVADEIARLVGDRFGLEQAK